MSRLHICFLSQEYPPETGWGGIGSYTYDLAHALVRAGHRVTVIARAEGEESVADDAGVEVHRVHPAPGWDRMKLLWRLNRVWPGFAWAAAKRLRAIHATTPVDVAEGGECRADALFACLSPLRGWRAVVRLHLAWIFVDRQNAIVPDARRRWTYWLEKVAIRRADGITAPSAAVVELTRTWLGDGLSARVIPNPVDVQAFVPQEQERVREILFVGRLEKRKGLELLAAATPLVLRRCPDVRFRFIGADGIDERGCSWRERILANVPAGQRERVIFEKISRAELVERYRRSSLCVIPSTWENFPYVGLEALASGTPVIATQTGGLPELVGEAGVLSSREDPDAFAAAICGLMNEPEQLRNLSLAARARAERLFASPLIAARMADYYRELCAV